MGRREDEDVAAAVGDTPDANAGGVNLWQVLGAGDRILVVLDLVPRIDVLAGLAVAGAHPPVVEDESGHALLYQLCGVLGLAYVLDLAPAAGHDHHPDGAASLRHAL